MYVHRRNQSCFVAGGGGDGSGVRAESLRALAELGNTNTATVTTGQQRFYYKIKWPWHHKYDTRLYKYLTLFLFDNSLYLFHFSPSLFSSACRLFLSLFAVPSLFASLASVLCNLIF